MTAPIVPVAQAAGTQTTDYAASNLAGIAKVMAVNPELGQKQLDMYTKREASADGFLAGMWNVISSPAKGLINILGNITSTFAEPFRDEKEGEEDNFLVDMWQGFTGQENTYWRDNLLSYGMKDGFAATALGLVGDIFLDPTTYIGAGLLGKAPRIVAEGSELIAKAGAKTVVEKELLAKGGIEFGGSLISKTDDFTSITQGMSRDSLIKMGVTEDVVEGLAGVAAANAERTVIGSVEALAQRSYESVGRIVADAIIQRKSIHALPEKFVDDIGRTWSKSEIVGIFEKTRKMGVEDLTKVANTVYGKTVSKQTAQELGRIAAAAQGGIRLKFGIPFTKRMAAAHDAPWLAYRWQTGALPFANRLRFGKGGMVVGGKLVTEGVAFSKVGDFFRGISGINRLDNAIQDSLQHGGVWQREHMDIFLKGPEGGFAGLRNHMMNGTPEEAAAFQQLFGNKVVSSFIPVSERMGDMTAALTFGARAWRRGGIIGMRSVDQIRFARSDKKVFRQFAAQHEEAWSKAAFQMEQDAAAGLISKSEVNAKMTRYLEGLTNDIEDLPVYLQGPVQEMRELYPKLLDKARQMGANVGDITEVFARRRAGHAVEMLQAEFKRLQDELNALNAGDAARGVDAAGQTTGVGAAREANKQALAARIMETEFKMKKVNAQLEKQKSVIENMDEYEAVIASLRPGGLVADKASPTMYFHRRLTKEARAAWIGNPKAGSRAFNKAKRTSVEMERQLAGLSLEEATAVMKARKPALANVNKIWEDNPFLVYAHYVEDMAEAVYTAKLSDRAQHLMSSLGGVDNGTFFNVGAKVRANMPKTIAKMEREAEGLLGQGREQMAEWLDQVSIGIGAKLDNNVDIPESVLNDLGIKTGGVLPVFRKAPTGRTWVRKGKPDEFSELTFDPTGSLPYGRMSAQRDTGVASGMYAFGTREGAEAIIRDGSVLRRVPAAVKPYMINTPDSVKGIQDVSRSLMRWAEEPGAAGYAGMTKHQAANHLWIAGLASGLKLSVDELVPHIDDALETWRKSKQVHPMNILLSKLGYDGIEYVGSAAKFADDGTYGNVKFPPINSKGEIIDAMPINGTYMRGTIPKMPEDKLRKLQGVMHEMNKLKAGINDLKAAPEKAIASAIEDVDTRLWGRLDIPGLEDVLMHPYIAAEFNKAWQGSKTGWGGMAGSFQKEYRSWLLGPWKKWATIYWPGFHARNAMGAWFNNKIGGVHHGHYGISGKLMDVMNKGEKSDWYTKVIPQLKGMSIDGIDGAITYRALADHMRDIGVYSENSLALADLRLLTSGEEGLSFTARSHRVSSKLKFPGSKLKDSRYGPVTGAEKFMRGWERMGVGSTNLIENYFRGAAFVKGLEDAAGDSAGARMFVMMRHGDYDELTDVEYAIRDLIPFYKWMRTNFPFQLRNIIENPGKQLATLDAAQAAVDPELRKKLPPWMKEQFSIQMPKGVLSSKDGPGILTLQLPLNDLFMGGNEFFSSFLPVTRQLLLENTLFKQNLYTGAPIEGIKREKVASWVDMAGLGTVMDKLGIAERDADGDLVMTDKQINALSVFPLFGRARNFLYDEPDRVKLRTNAFLSAAVGVGLRSADKELMNDAEADWFFNIVKPEMDNLRALDYPLPSIDDVARLTAVVP